MFNDLETKGLIRSVSEDRFSVPYCSEVVIADLIAKHDFGAGFFHKILNKSILKPGSTAAK
jgi:hypothetical protein